MGHQALKYWQHFFNCREEAKKDAGKPHQTLIDAQHPSDGDILPDNLTYFREKTPVYAADRFLKDVIDCYENNPTANYALKQQIELIKSQTSLEDPFAMSHIDPETGERVLTRNGSSGWLINTIVRIRQQSVAFIFAQPGGTISIAHGDNFRISLDGHDWVEWDGSTFIVNGTIVFVQARSTVPVAGISGDFVKVSGNLMALANCDEISTLKPSQFYHSSSDTGLFFNCTSLTDASNLLFPTTLTEDCYRKMFYNCTALVTPPNLIAKALVPRCYQEMFKNCTSLTSISCYATDISAEDCTLNWASWADDPTHTGLFYSDVSTVWPEQSPSGVPKYWRLYALFTITASAYRATVSCKVNGQPVTLPYTALAGSEVELTCNPLEGCYFTKWTEGTAEYTDNPLTFELTRDCNFSTTCEVELVSISAYGRFGTVTAFDMRDNPLEFPYVATYGTRVKLVCTPNEHYSFSRWDDASEENPHIVIMKKNHQYIAYSHPIDFLIEVEGINCAVTGAGYHQEGSLVTLTLTPDFKCQPSASTWSGLPKDAVISPDFKTVTFYSHDPLRIKAVCDLEKYVISGTCSYGSVVGYGTYSYGDTVTLAATPNAHFHFVKWTDGTTEYTDNPLTFTAEMDRTIDCTCVSDTCVVVASAIHGLVTGSGTYNYGDLVTLKCIPEDGHAFNHWSNKSVLNPFSFRVTSDTNLIAVCTVGSYTVSAICEHGTVTGTGSFNYGDICTLECIPTPGWRFYGWSDGIEANPRIFTVTGNVTLEAYTDTKRKVTAIIEHATVSGQGFYDVGSSVILQVTAQHGWKFNKWSDGNTDNPRTILVPAVDVEYTGSCIPGGDFLIEAACINGTISGQGYYNVGETVTLTATPMQHFYIDASCWTGLPIGATMSVDLLTATFPAQNATVLVTCVEDPKISLIFNAVGATCSPATFAGHTGDQVTVSVTPFTHFSWGSWDDLSTDNPRTFTIGTYTKTYTATCIEEPKYTLTFLGGDHGTVDPPTYVGYEGDTVTVTAIPNQWFTFKEWSDGQAGNPRTFTVFDESATYSAIFEAMPTYTLTFTCSVGGTLDKNSFTGHIGDTVTVTGTPNTGYRFKRWSDGDTNNPRTFIIESSKSYQLVFEEIPTYTLTFNVTKGTSSPATFTGHTGDSVQVSVIPNAHYHWDHWYDGNTDNPRTFTIGTFSETIYGYCTTSEQLFTLWFETIGGHGMAFCRPNQFEGFEGDTVSVEAVNSGGEAFQRWEDTGTDENPRVFTIGSSSKTYYAVFNDYGSRTDFVCSNGQCFPEYSSQVGVVVPVSIIPSPGYKFTKWQDECAAMYDNPRNFTIEAGYHSYHASCERAYTLTFNASDGGSVIATVDGSPVTSPVQVVEYAEVELTAIPSPGYEFSAWSDGYTGSTRQFRMGSEDMSFTATFTNEYLTFRFPDSSGGYIKIDASSDTQLEYTTSNEGVPYSTWNVMVIGSTYTIANHYCHVRHAASGPVNPGTISHISGDFNMVSGQLKSLLTSGTAEPTMLPSQFSDHENGIGLFSDVDTLTDASNLILLSQCSEYGYWGMFSGCTVLEYPPAIPCTAIGKYGLANMFYSCVKLHHGPDLSGISAISEGCFFAMLEGCTRITNPRWPSSIASIPSHGAERMYANCSNLTSFPSLSNITNIENSGMVEMFFNCSRLAGPIYLPSTSASTNTTLDMFSRAGSAHPRSSSYWVDCQMYVPSAYISSWESTNAGISDALWKVDPSS